MIFLISSRRGTVLLPWLFFWERSSRSAAGFADPKPNLRRLQNFPSVPTTWVIVQGAEPLSSLFRPKDCSDCSRQPSGWPDESFSPSDTNTGMLKANEVPLKANRFSKNLPRVPIANSRPNRAEPLKLGFAYSRNSSGFLARAAYPALAALH